MRSATRPPLLRLVAGVDVAGAPTDVVYVGSAPGWLSAVRANDGSLIWRRNLGAQHTGCPDLPHGTFGVSGPPFLDLANGRLFVVGGDGELHALDLVSGAERPGWPVVITNAPERNHVYGAINLVDGRVYVATASFCDFTPYHGRVVAFDATTGPSLIPGSRSGGVALPWGYLGTGRRCGGSRNWRCLRRDGQRAHLARVLPARRGGRSVGCQPPRRGTRRPRTPFVFDNIGATPLLFQAAGCPLQLVVKQKSGQLFLYNTDGVDGGYRQVVHVANSHGWQFNGIPAFSATTNMVDVTNNSDSDLGPFVHDRRVPRRTPVSPVARVAASSRPRERERIATHRGRWRRLLRRRPRGYGACLRREDRRTPVDEPRHDRRTIFAAAAVVNGMLYVGSWDGTLYAFGLPA